MAAQAGQTNEYRAAREEVAWADLSAREQLQVTGPDRVSYLQGMVTNDVEKLPVGASCYAAVLTPKGAMVADARVLKLAEALVVDTGGGCGEALRAFLDKYLISEEAEVVPAPQYAVVALVGPKAAGLLAALPAGAVVGTLAPLGAPGLDALVLREQWGAVTAALAGVQRLSDETLEVLRVEAGAPRFGRDMGDHTIPLEANLERAIDYHKGCYIGQEVIARGTYRGQMNKRLVGLLLGDAAPEPGAELRKADKKVGWLTSVVRSPLKGQQVALGYVHRDHLAEGSELELAGGGKAVVCALPFT